MDLTGNLAGAVSARHLAAGGTPRRLFAFVSLQQTIEFDGAGERGRDRCRAGTGPAFVPRLDARSLYLQATLPGQSRLRRPARSDDAATQEKRGLCEAARLIRVIRVSHGRSALRERRYSTAARGVCLSGCAPLACATQRDRIRFPSLGPPAGGERDWNPRPWHSLPAAAVFLPGLVVSGRFTARLLVAVRPGRISRLVAHPCFVAPLLEI